MNGDQSMAHGLCVDLVAEIATFDGIDVILCPPSTLIQFVDECLDGSTIAIGAQDIDHHPSGAFTGQVSAAMVKQAGAQYTLVGHSERREYFGETDERIAQKVAAALSNALTPILCIGETLEQRQAGNTEQTVKSQLDAVLAHCGISAFNNIIIAYEPVWAIGTGLSASPTEAQQVHQFIRQLLSQQDSGIAEQCRILYGGSMKPENAADLIQQDDIDGGLIGGASLKSNDFLAICKAAARTAAH